MFKHKKILALGLAIALTFGAFMHAGANDETDIRFSSNRFTQMESEQELTNYNTNLDGFTQVATNPYLTLFVDETSLAIKVRNETTGYIWSSTLDNMENYRLNETWRNFVASAVTVEFIRGEGNPTRESVLTDDDTHIEFNQIEGGFSAHITFGNSGIALEVTVVLEEADVVVGVLDESVFEPADITLLSLQLFPFFGATFENNVPGYMFIPDGAGALSRLDVEPVMSAPFRGMFYGDDFGITFGAVTLINPPQPLSMPVYGMIHGVHQNGFLTIIEGGDHYAELTADRAGTFTEFNWMATTFHYRQSYFQPTTRDITRGPTISMNQEVRNSFDIIMRHRILSDGAADYVGMALAYQARLVETGVLTPLVTYGPMMRLDVLGAESEPGLIWDNVVVMTEVRDILTMTDALQNQGMSQFMVNYFGWARGGLSNSFPNRSRFERRLGSRNDVTHVIDTLEVSNIPLFFHTDYVRVTRGIDRIIGRPRLAQQINTRPIGNRMVPTDALNQVQRDMNNFNRYGITNLSISSTSSMTFSSWNPGMEATRTENLATNRAIIDTLNAGDISRTALFEPNANHWHQGLYYFDIPMTASGFLFATDTVPFIHIVLRGHMNYYAPASNFSANSRTELLRSIEFGAYPTFVLTKQPSHLLADTRSSHIFTSEFTLWEETVVAYYEIVSAALESVRGTRIVGRTVLAPGVVKVSYENNVDIIVNYTATPFTYSSITVEPAGFAVVNGGDR